MPVPDGVERIDVTTTKEMYDAVLGNLDRADVVIKAAAPADYKVEKVSDKKIKSDELTLKLTKNPDIAAAVGKIKGDKKLVIFSAETNDCEANARAKLKKKNADMVVLNDVTKKGAGFNTDTNVVTVITRDDEKEFGLLDKTVLADLLLDEIGKL